MLLRSETSDDVSIAGRVSDASPLAFLRIDTEPVPLSPDGLAYSFSTSQESRWGLNVIAGVAEDECGNHADFARSYLQSDLYRPSATEELPTAGVPDGLVVHLNQPAIDDLNRSDLDDVASVVEASLLGTDFNAMLPAGTVLAQNGLRGGCSFCQFWGDTSYFVRRHSSAAQLINWLGPWITYLQAIEGGFALQLRVDNLDVPLQASGTVRECACGVQATQTTGTFNGWAGVDRVDATGTIAVSMGTGQIQTSVNSLTLNTTGLYLDLDCGWADFLCDVATDTALPVLAGEIEDTVGGVVADQVAPLLEDLLREFEIDEALSVPAPFETPMRMTARIASVDFDGPLGSGNGELTLTTQTFPELRSGAIAEEALGAIARQGARPGFSSLQYSLGFGLSDDVLNQLLWSVWYGGGLQLDADELAELLGGEAASGIDLELDATLPPVLTPGDTPGTVRVSLGDARVEGTIDLEAALGTPGAGSVELSAYISIVADCSLELDPETNALRVVALDAEPTIHVEFTSLDRPAQRPLALDALRAALDAFAPTLADQLLAALPLPQLDLASHLDVDTTLELGDGELARPTASNFCLAGEEDPSHGYLCLTGQLE
jgi:hypothetical protein